MIAPISKDQSQTNITYFKPLQIKQIALIRHLGLRLQKYKNL